MHADRLAHFIVALVCAQCGRRPIEKRHTWCDFGVATVFKEYGKVLVGRGQGERHRAVGIGGVGPSDGGIGAWLLSLLVNAYPCVLPFGGKVVIDGDGLAEGIYLAVDGDRGVASDAPRHGEFLGVRPLRPFHVVIAVAHTQVIGAVFQTVHSHRALGDIHIFIDVYGDMERCAC